MTLLSQSLELLRRARALLREVEAQEPATPEVAIPAQVSAELPATQAPSALPRAVTPQPRLRLVKGGAAPAPLPADRDSSIRVSGAPTLPGPLAVGAPTFLAGTGARLYSLDAWRREHPPRGRTPHAA